MRSVIAAFAVAALVSCQSTGEQAKTEESKTRVTDTMNVLSSAEKEEGWMMLFDGKTKDGWHIYNHTSDGAAWKVSDGVLYLDTLEHKDWQIASGGDLVSDSTFSNFDLKLEWKISKNGNSGILFYVQEDPQYEYSYYTGPEMQVLDNDGHPDGKIIKHRAGDLYDLITSKPETVKPVGEWNQAEIVADNGHLSFFLNGTKVVETTLWDDAWKQMVADSKFKQWPAFGTFKEGHIVLQDHGNMVWYRNVKIRKW